jgi:hypothetical protein
VTKKTIVPREVYIATIGTSPHYAVEYVHRKRGTRYWAAQFDGRHSTLAEIIEWVKKQPKLILVDTEVRKTK